MRIYSSDHKITASRELRDLDDLGYAIANILDSDLCEELVNLANSEDGAFDDAVFMDTADFFDTYLANEEPKEVVLKFFNGKDLDSKGQANPNRDYLRFDKKDNIESTNDPGEIYMNELFDDIIDYVLDHMDELEYPEDIQELIDRYSENFADRSDSL